MSRSTVRSRAAEAVAIVVIVLAAVVGPLTLAPVAYASTSIDISGADVPRGSGTRVVVTVIYSCDESSGVSDMVVTVSDLDTNAQGTAQLAPTCDGLQQSHGVKVQSGSPLLFRSGDRAIVQASLVDAEGSTASGSTTGGTRTLG